MIVKVLTDEQIRRIHLASLEILENTGFIVPHEDILSRFKNYGADIDDDINLVKLPSTIVEELVSKADRKFTIYGRDLNKKAEFGHNKRNYNSTAGQAFWLDEIGEKRRYSTLNDVKVATKFADALELITIPGAMSDPLEIPTEWRCIAVASEMIKNTTKPIMFWFYDRPTAKYLVELLTIIRGDKRTAEKYPMYFPLFEPVTPLNFPFHGIDLLFETSKINLPALIGPMAQMGLTAPATLAGTMALENAELLAAICITQIIREGMPVCYGGICHAFDMKTAQIIFGGPEQAIFSVAMCQMGKHYGLPTYINAGLTDSKNVDAQAGLESGITLALGTAAGADIFGHMGISGMDQGSSLDILVMQSEIISFLESVNRDISFEDDDFATALISDVGPKGNFLNQRHTRDNIRHQLWFPDLLDRKNYDNWLKLGKSDMAERCRELKEEILKERTTEPLPSDMNLEIEALIEKAKIELTRKT